MVVYPSIYLLLSRWCILLAFVSYSALKFVYDIDSWLSLAGLKSHGLNKQWEGERKEIDPKRLT